MCSDLNNNTLLGTYSIYSNKKKHILESMIIFATKTIDKCTVNFKAVKTAQGCIVIWTIYPNKSE